MEIPFELHIAFRYLIAKRKQAFISIVSLISTVGVGVGVMAVVIALAMMTGMQVELRDRIVGANPHVYVWNTRGIADYHVDIDALRKVPHVIGAAPAVLGKALITASKGQEFISLKGIDPALEPSVTDIRGAMQQGKVEDIVPKAGSDELGGILLGKDLAAHLGVGVGDSVQLLTPEGTLSPMGMIPHARRLRVAGTFSLGLYEIDMTFGFVSLDMAKRLVGKDEVELIQLRVDDIYQASAISRAIPKQLGDQYMTRDWTEMNGSLFSALWLEKVAVSLAIGLIVIVAALNIVASLILLVMDKNRDIAILKTMGAGTRSVTAIFMIQGLVIGLVGTAAGATLGFATARVMDKYQLIRMPVDVYQVSYLPFRVLSLDLALIVSVAVLICFVATIYPSRQAAKLDPAQALRYE